MENKEKISLRKGLLETAPFHSANAPVVEISYMEYAEDPGDILSPNTTAFDEGGFAQISIHIAKMAIQMESYRTAASIPMSTARDLDVLHGVSTTGMMEDTLRNEAVMRAEKNLAEKYWSAGWSSRESTRTGWQKRVLRLLAKKNFDIYKYIESETDADRGRILMATVLSMANRVAKACRRGPGNFAIVPAEIMSYLEDCPGFVYLDEPSSSIIRTGNTRYVAKGMIANVKVYVDTHAKYNSGEILVGRTGRGDEPGIHFVEYSNEFLETVDHISLENKVCLLSRYAVAPVGNIEGMYLAEKIVIGKKPWWRKLFKL